MMIARTNLQFSTWNIVKEPIFETQPLLPLSLLATVWRLRTSAVNLRLLWMWLFTRHRKKTHMFEGLTRKDFAQRSDHCLLISLIGLMADCQGSWVAAGHHSSTMVYYNRWTSFLWPVLVWHCVPSSGGLLFLLVIFALCCDRGSFRTTLVSNLSEARVEAYRHPTGAVCRDFQVMSLQRK